MAGPVREAILEHLAAGNTVTRRDATRQFGNLALSVLSQLTARGAITRQGDTYAARIRAIPDPALLAIEARERAEREAAARRRVAESMEAERAEVEAKRAREQERKRLIDAAIDARRLRAQTLAAMPEAARPKYLKDEEILRRFAPALEKLKAAPALSSEASETLADLFNLDIDD